MTHRLLAAAVLLAASLPAAAQDAPEAPVSDPADYRWAIYTSCTVVFLAILVYLGITHARAARVADDVAAVERRLAELEGAPPAKP